jgi:hypothetical protein
MIILQLNPEQLDSLIQNAVRKVNTEIPKAESYQEIEKPLNTKGAAEFLGITVNTVYGYTFRKVIPFSKKGKFNYFYKSQLIEWIKEGQRKMVSEIEAAVINETDAFLSKVSPKKRDQ